VFSFEGPGEALVTYDADNRAWLWHPNGSSTDLGLIRGSVWALHRWATFSPDGRVFCLGGDWGTAKVWDTATGKERFTLPGRISGAQFSSDGARLATVGAEHVARIWSVENGREVRTLRGHAEMVEHVRFSPDNRLVATADHDGVVKLWSAGNGREVLPGDSWTWGGCYSPDGKRLASISNPILDLRVWDAESGAELLRFRPGMEHVCLALQFSPDGRFLATGGGGGDVRLWDSTTGREIRRLPGHREMVCWLAFSPSGRQLAAGANDGTARLWEIETGTLQHVLASPARGITKVAFSPDGRRLYASGADGFVRAWDTQSGGLLMQAGEGRPALLDFALTPDGRNLYLANAVEDTLQPYDSITGRPLPTAALPLPPGVFMSFTPDGRRMAMAVQDMRGGYGASQALGSIVDIERGRQVLAFRGVRTFITSLQFDRQGRRLMGCIMGDGGDFTTRQWETFPWREEEYAEDGGQRTEVGGRRTETRGPRSEKTLPERVRAYADRYWRERLQAEATAKPPPPRQPMVRWDRSLWPKRDDRSGPNQIDLTEQYTTRLDVPPYPVCAIDKADNDLRELPSGTGVWSNITFDVRGVVMLRQLSMRGYPWRWHWEQHPARVDGIRLETTFQRLHVFHGMLQGYYEPLVVESGMEVGHYTLHYADGTQADLPIVVGRHVRNWWVEATEENPYQPLPEGTVVWTGSNPSAKDAKATLRLYLTSYDNPHPENEVVSVDFVSAMTTAAPFLVAMTIEP